MKSALRRAAPANKRWGRRWPVGALLLLWLAACGAPPPPEADTVLLRVGQQTITVAEFETAFAIGQMAYDYADLQRPAVWREARRRLLNQLLEEALVLEKARVEGIRVDEDELSEAVQRLRGDYPPGVFEEALLKNAVPEEAWRERLRVRLLMEKTARRVIGATVDISPEEIAALIDEAPGETPPVDGREGAALVERLRRRKIEAAYPEWVRELRETFTVEINQPQWERLLTPPGDRPPA